MAKSDNKADYLTARRGFKVDGYEEIILSGFETSLEGFNPCLSRTSVRHIFEAAGSSLLTGCSPSRSKS